MSQHLFSGLKVIDCASWVAGPAAATILSDFGADVIKLEPPGGDPWRNSTPMPGKKTDYYWQHTSRNKRSLALDLKAEEGLAILHRLIDGADVFITNYPLPVRERLKIADRHLLARNPRLIYASLTAYGEHGDEAGKTGFDVTAYWARTGLMDLVRATPDTEPARSTPAMGDHPSATALYAAIVTALYRREKSGKGGVAQSSLLQNGLWANACLVQTRLAGEHIEHRNIRDQAPSALANHYRCRDGRWLMLGIRTEEKQWPAFVRIAGEPRLSNDPLFATSEARKANASALIGVLDAVFAGRDLSEWRTVLDAAGITFGGIYSTDEAGDDAQPRAIGAIVPFADGKGETVSSPFHLDGEAKIAPRRAPSVGQHTEAVLAEAGYSGAEIARLRSLGVLA